MGKYLSNETLSINKRCLIDTYLKGDESSIWNGHRELFCGRFGARALMRGQWRSPSATNRVRPTDADLQTNSFAPRVSANRCRLGASLYTKGKRSLISSNRQAPLFFSAVVSHGPEYRLWLLVVVPVCSHSRGCAVFSMDSYSGGKESLNVGSQSGMRECFEGSEKDYRIKRCSTVL